MKLTTTAFSDNGAIPAEFAFGAIDPAHHVRLSGNRNPDFAWSGVPAGTQSLALICHDPDVPSRGDDVNQEGRIVPASLPRVDFFHWMLVDLPADAAPIAPRRVLGRRHGARQARPDGAARRTPGINDYTGWFAGDTDMAGNYFGYDGPCPPWNDSIVHHYTFTLFALDVARLAVAGTFGGADARKAMAGHVLAQAAVTGRYTLNRAVSL